jgi:hypothetical protein
MWKQQFTLSVRANEAALQLAIDYSLLHDDRHLTLKKYIVAC